MFSRCKLLLWSSAITLAASGCGVGIVDTPSTEAADTIIGDDPIDDPYDDPVDDPNDDPVDDPNDPVDDPNDDPVDDPIDDPNDDPADCQDDDDCGEDQVCSPGQGACVPDCQVSGCQDESKECNPDTGLCQAVESITCTTDPDCPGDSMICAPNGTCVETFGPCASDADCSDGLFCPPQLGQCIVDNRSQGG